MNTLARQRALTLALLALQTALVLSCASQEVRMDTIHWHSDNPVYREFYGWDETKGSWKTRSVAVPGTGTVAYHLFTPAGAEPKGTCYLIHGYLEHGPLRMPLILFLLEQGWEAIAIDLPGHGLSGGSRGEIDSFSSYTASLEAVLDAEPRSVPLAMIAHSIGCAITMRHAVEYGTPFGFAILEAPLVRTWLWKPSTLAVKLFDGAISSLPGRNIVPHGYAFRKVLEDDPLYIKRVPLSWFKAVENHVADSERWTVIPGNYYIIQGQKDTVVDHEYNIPFLEDHMEKVDVVMVAEGNHHLLRDEGTAGDLARQALVAFWKEGTSRLGQNP